MPLIFYDTKEFFGKAYLIRQTDSIAINGFMKTDIHRCDREVFIEADFIASQNAASKESETRPTNQRAAPNSTITASSGITSSTGTSSPINATHPMRLLGKSGQFQNLGAPFWQSTDYWISI
jgi:hypothetical protein